MGEEIVFIRADIHDAVVAERDAALARGKALESERDAALERVEELSAQRNVYSERIDDLEIQLGQLKDDFARYEP